MTPEQREKAIEEVVVSLQQEVAGGTLILHPAHLGAFIKEYEQLERTIRAVKAIYSGVHL